MRGTKARRQLLLGLTALVAAGFLGFLLTVVLSDGPSAVDTWWQSVMIGWRPEVVIQLAHLLNTVGGGLFAIFVPPLAIALGLILARRWRAVIFAVAAFAASALLIQILKHLFARARPEDMLVASDFGSFPSGHTANAATIAAVMYLLFPRLWVFIVGAVWTLMMALSRTALSVHWATDTLGGALVGLGVSLVLMAFLGKWLAKDHHLNSGDSGTIVAASDRS